MDLLYAILLGIVQGLTEFLPVSSSGHLVLMQQIFNINAPGLFFDTMLHAGTLIAVFAVLWKDIWEIIKKPVQPLTLYLIIGTIPAVITALLLKDFIYTAFDTGHFLGFCFLVTTVFLITAELLSRRTGLRGKDTSDSPAANLTAGRLSTERLSKKTDMNWLDALITGLMQAIALAPGISRSGATISGALFRKLNRDLAARFSFLLSIPAILGALVFQAKDLIKGVQADTAAESIGTAAVIAGTITAAVVGFFAVRFMLKIIREKSLYGFAIYTGILGILVIIDRFITQIIFT